MPRTITSPIGPEACPLLRVPDRPDAKIALRGVKLHCKISGMSQRTSIYQTFINQEAEAVEVVYTFPLPDGAAVCGFEVVTADRVLTGQIEECDNAIDQYEQAVGQGHGAYLMEQDRPDVFSVRVGNLKPRQAATIRLSYVCPLERADKSIRVAFPTTLAPRYASDTGTDPLEAIIDGESLNPPHLLHVPYGLSMEVEIDLGRKVMGVTSPSHAIRVEPEDGRQEQTLTASHLTRVTLAGGHTEMDRDIVLSIALAKEHEPRAQCERGKDGANYLAVTFVPEFDVEGLAGPDGHGPAPRETVFVLDCSGSMAGDSISQATAALELCLRGMNKGDTFNISRFGSSFEVMAGEPVRYRQESLDRAVAFVRKGADMGGTELYGPLEAILRQPPVVGKVRQIVLLTDGQVTNEPACIDLARRNRLRNRIFSFGIGPACSTHLVRGLARVTGGAAEFITAGERIDDKVLRTFSRLARPMISDVSIDWGGAEVQTLAELPPIFDGDVLAVFGRCEGRLPAAVTLSCSSGSRPLNWRVAVPPAVEQVEGVIATMWARRTIQSLEEVNGLTGARSRPAVQSRERDLVVSLSKQFGLLSSLTTFITIEHRSVEERNQGSPALRRVPLMLAAGWGGIERSMPPGTALAANRYIDKSIDCSIDRSLDCSPRLPVDLAGFTASGDPVKQPIIRLVKSTIDDAFRRGSAEIHVEPLRDHVRIRYRTGNTFEERDRIKQSMKNVLLSTIKQAAGMNESQTALPQEGIIRLKIDGKPVDVHVSTLPSRNGESAVLRFGHGLAAPLSDSDLRRLLALQQADGSFALSIGNTDEPNLTDLLSRCSHDAAAWIAQIESFLGASAPEPAVVTISVLELLRICFSNCEPLWRRAGAKAVQYVARTTARPPDEILGFLTAWFAASPK